MTLRQVLRVDPLPCHLHEVADPPAYSGGRPTVYLTPAVGYASHPCYAHLERVGQAFYDSYFRDSPESQRHIYDDQDAPTAVVAAPSGPANAAGLIDRAKA